MGPSRFSYFSPASPPQPSPARPADAGFTSPHNQPPQVPEWLTSCAAPVLYYEQGHEWLFGDPVRFHEGSAAAAQVRVRVGLCEAACGI